MRLSRALSCLTGSSGLNEKSDAAFRGLAGRRLPHRAMSSIRERVKSFLDGTQRALAIVGPSGTGKLYAIQQAVRERGLTCIVHDRSQGSINYRLWGAATLANHGLAASVHVLLSADGETDFCFVARLPPACKVVCVANEVSEALKAARIPIERVKPLTPEAMAKMLFLESDWGAVAAQRVSRLAQGDWRQVENLKRLFDGAGVNLSGASEEAFQAALEQMARDKHTVCHPSLRVHSLFSGTGQQEDHEDPAVLPWGESNLGLTCDSLESMAAMQEAAATADVLCKGGQYELGLDHFARSASAHRQTGLRYDYAQWSNPWAVPAEKTTKPVRESFARLEPWSRSLKRRLAVRQHTSDDAPKPKAKGKARATKPKCRQTRTAQ